MNSFTSSPPRVNAETPVPAAASPPLLSEHDRQQAHLLDLAELAADPAVNVLAEIVYDMNAIADRIGEFLDDHKDCQCVCCCELKDNALGPPNFMGFLVGIHALICSASAADEERPKGVIDSYPRRWCRVTSTLPLPKRRAVDELASDQGEDDDQGDDAPDAPHNVVVTR